MIALYGRGGNTEHLEGNQMTVLTDDTKVSRVNTAFAKVASDYVNEGNNKKALALINALETLGRDSKVKLFDILTKSE